MKPLSKLAFVAALALAGTALLPSMKADTLVYSDGDLFMGFRSPTATNDYLVDIGQFSLYNNNPVGTHISLGNWGADLSSNALFGANWATDPNVLWGVAGDKRLGGFPPNTNLYASKMEPVVGTFAIPWERNSSSSQSSTASFIATMGQNDYAGNQSTVNNSRGYIEPVTNSNGWTAYQPGGQFSGGISFQTWNPTIEASGSAVNGNFGITSTRLDLFEIAVDNTGSEPPSTYIGSFDIDAAGNVSFDVFSAVPEPSTYASLIAGAALLLVAMRFRRRTRLV